MAYALTIIVVSAFLIVYFIVKKKPKEEWQATLDEKKYLEKCKAFVLDTPIPKKTSQINDKFFKRHIKTNIFLLKQKKYKGIFADFCEDKQAIEQLCKIDFSCLCDAPSINQTPRSVLLAKLCMSSSGWIFTEDRFRILVNEQNKRKTLTYVEMSTMKEAFLYAILEKTYYIFENLKTIAKVCKLAKKYVNDSFSLQNSKKIKSFVKSKLFLELCMIEANYNKTNKGTLEGVMDGLYTTYARVIDSIRSVLCFDFSRYYSPLEIYDKFSSFSNATENQKSAFLSVASALSDNENLDEFMYAIRVEKYMQSASAGHSKVKKVDLFDKEICIISHKKDIAMLAAALNSEFFMRVFFGDKKNKSNKSISKIIDFENSFEPIYKFENLNFGISTSNDVLRICPHLPKNILKADVVFENAGTTHTMHIMRGDDTKIYLGNTKVEGTKFIRLAKKPLDVTVIVKD